MFVGEFTMERFTKMGKIATKTALDVKKTPFGIGFEKLEVLKLKMQKNRTKRLMECGIAEELADDLSKAHTPNFM